MSNHDITIFFQKFGKIMIFLAILSILSFIITIFTLTSIIIIIISFKLKSTFILIASRLLILGIIFRTNIIIISFIALRKIKPINRALDDFDLHKFCSRIIIASILRVFWYFVIVYFFFNLTIERLYQFYYLILLIFLFAFFFVLFIISAIFEMQAWGFLNNFFSYKKESFPKNIGNSARMGVILCKNAILFELIIISWFLGDILRIIGYYKLANLRYLTKGDVIIAPIPPTKSIQQLSIPVPTLVTKFCVNCGKLLVGNEKFCTFCGVKI